MKPEPNGFERRIFRPVLASWLGRIILPLAFLAVLAVTAINLLAASPGLMWLALALLPSIGLVAGIYAIPILLGQVEVNRAGMWANVDGMRLSLPWKDVRALRVALQDNEPYLIVGVGSGLYVAPLHHFNSQKIWEAIQAAAPKNALLPDAFDYYERKDGLEGIPPDLWMVGTLRVMDSRWLSFAAAVGAAGFLLLFVIGLFEGLPGKPVYLAFGVLYLLALTATGTTELDLKGVTRRTVFGVSYIAWDELSAVEVGPFSLRIVLEGMRGRRLALFGPPMWTGLDAARAAHFLALQISTRRLPRRRSFMVLFRYSRNTKQEGEE